MSWVQSTEDDNFQLPFVPRRTAILTVITFSILINVTRFFELRQVETQVPDWTTIVKVNGTFGFG